MTSLANLWNATLGCQMSLRMERSLLRRVRWNQEIYSDWLQKYVTRTTRWLDAGCGRRLLPPDFYGLERELLRKPKFVIGVDADTVSLGCHKNLALRTCAPLGALPFPDQSFDLVTCNMVVEHLPDPKAVFREFARVLCPGGVLLVHTPNTWNYAVTLARMLKKVIPARVLLQLIRWTEDRQYGDIFPTYYRANSRSSITSKLESLGFSCEQFEMLVGPQPVCRFFAPIAVSELLLMRATRRRSLNAFATTMLCSFRKSPAADHVSTLALPHNAEYSTVAC